MPKNNNQEFKNGKQFVRQLGGKIKEVVVRPTKWGKEVMRAGVVEPTAKFVHHEIRGLPSRIREQYQRGEAAKTHYLSERERFKLQALSGRAEVEAWRRWGPRPPETLRERFVGREVLRPRIVYPQPSRVLVPNPKFPLGSSYPFVAVQQPRILPQMPRICRYCGMRFVPDMHHRAYCSNDCRAQMRRMPRRRLVYPRLIRPIPRRF
jgi:hypothetical protein